MKNRIAAIAYAIAIPFLWIICIIIAIIMGLKSAVYAFIDECQDVLRRTKMAYYIDKQLIRTQWHDNVSHMEALEIVKKAEKKRRIDKFFGNSQN